MNQVEKPYTISVIPPEEKPGEHWNKTPNLREEFVHQMKKKLGIQFTVTLNEIYILRYRSTCGGTDPNDQYINAEFLWLSFRLRKKSIGVICVEWYLAQLKSAMITIFWLNEEQLADFRKIKPVHLRVIVLLDDICHKHPSAFFAGKLCNYCKRFASHQTWRCPLHPTEKDRKKAVEGQIITGRKCDVCKWEKADHVGWRCASETRMGQLQSVTNRYHAMWLATKLWPPEHLINLLRHVCQEYDIPFPADISTRSFNRRAN